MSNWAKQRIEELERVRKDMAAGIQRATARGRPVNHMQDAHDQATAEIERIKKLEESAPVAKLVNGWVLAWIAGVVGLVGGAVAMKVLGI